MNPAVLDFATLRGITDTKGTRADKQEGSGHRSANMMDTYDLSVPLVPAAGD